MKTAKLYALTGLAALVVAGAAASDAAACRIGPMDRAHYPIMAHYVREAPSIVLARPVSAEATGRGEVREIYTYTFEVIEVIKGETITSFELEGLRPFLSSDLRVCETADLSDRTSGRACQVAVENERLRLSAYDVANTAREDWTRFHFMQSRMQSGMGGVDTYDVDRIVVDCGTRMPSFELDQSFLIFRDGVKQLDDPQGLNHQLITRDADAWLQAVRYFVSAPAADYLPAKSVGEVLESFGNPEIIEAEYCQELQGHPALAAGNLYSVTYEEPSYYTEIRFPVPHQERDAYLSHCEASGRFLIYPGAFDDDIISTPFSTLTLFPIRDGIVDYTGLASQWAINEDRFVTLDEVLSWRDDP